MSETDAALARRIMFTVHDGLPREGPGNRASTARALSAVGDLASEPRLLDVGCGPGMQTGHLAELLPGANIEAIDAHADFVAEARARVRAAGAAERVTVTVADMRALDFAPQSFDLIWCEGAAYIMGVADAVTAWRPLLKPRGAIALTDAVWLGGQPPRTLAEWWQAGYPDMTDVPGCLQRVAAAGYELLEHFVLPESAWWDDYYKPLEARLARLRVEFENDAQVMHLLQGHQQEIDFYRRWSEHYGYLFVIARRAD